MRKCSKILVLGIVALGIALAGISCREAADTAIPKLEQQLQDKDTHVRNRAALKLAGYGPDAKHSVPGLIRLLQDENYGVRSSAAFALREIGTPEAQKALDNYH